MTLLNLDCFEALRLMKPVRMIFADPPDNIKLKYETHKDNMTPGEYKEFLIDLIYGSIYKCDVFWLSYNVRHTFTIGTIMERLLGLFPTHEAKPCVQVFTFGQHNKNDLGNCHRPLLRIMKKGTKVYPDAVRVPSWRQLNGDKRADSRGKVPGDVFDMPRVTGNSKQRRSWIPTQLHEDLYERCIRLSCKKDDTVCDLFAGSGTLARVAERCKVKALLVDSDPTYCKRIALEHKLEYSDD
jgi:site-specific DNA-methyltransferase (adenine-specific)